MNEILLPAARAYAARRELELAETLGSGKDGIVIVALRKAQPARVALKTLRWLEAYEREKNVYERLQHAEVTTVLGFNVPQLLRFDDQALVIEIDDCRKTVRSRFRRRLPGCAPGIPRRSLERVGI